MYALKGKKGKEEERFIHRKGREADRKGECPACYSALRKGKSKRKAVTMEDDGERSEIEK